MYILKNFKQSLRNTKLFKTVNNLRIELRLKSKSFFTTLLVAIQNARILYFSGLLFAFFTLVLFYYCFTVGFKEGTPEIRSKQVIYMEDYTRTVYFLQKRPLRAGLDPSSCPDVWFWHPKEYFIQWPILYNQVKDPEWTLNLANIKQDYMKEIVRPKVLKLITRVMGTNRLTHMMDSYVLDLKNTRRTNALRESHKNEIDVLRKIYRKLDLHKHMQYVDHSLKFIKYKKMHENCFFVIYRTPPLRFQDYTSDISDPYRHSKTNFGGMSRPLNKIIRSQLIKTNFCKALLRFYDKTYLQRVIHGLYRVSTKDDPLEQELSPEVLINHKNRHIDDIRLTDVSATPYKYNYLLYFKNRTNFAKPFYNPYFNYESYYHPYFPPNVALVHNYHDLRVQPFEYCVKSIKHLDAKQYQLFKNSIAKRQYNYERALRFWYTSALQLQIILALRGLYVLMQFILDGISYFGSKRSKRNK